MLVGRVQGIISFQSSSIVKISVYSKINSKQDLGRKCSALFCYRGEQWLHVYGHQDGHEGGQHGWDGHQVGWDGH